MDNEEDIIVLSEWKVGISRRKDDWLILLYLEGKDDYCKKKHQWDIETFNKNNGINQLM